MRRHFRRKTSLRARNRSPMSSFLRTGARRPSCATTICGSSRPAEAPHGPSRGTVPRHCAKAELDWMYPAELGTKHGYAWSPDSSRIAYLEFNLTGVASYTPPFQLAEDPTGANHRLSDAGKQDPSGASLRCQRQRQVQGGRHRYGDGRGCLSAASSMAPGRKAPGVSDDWTARSPSSTCCLPMRRRGRRMSYSRTKTRIGSILAIPSTS